MTELTDLQICKRIAEIEGEEVRETDDGLIYYCGCSDTGQIWEEYNLIENGGLCWDLMISHELDFFKTEDNFYCVSWSLRLSDYIENICPQRAVCLAIIEKHNENN